MYKLYYHKNLINNKYYIGITSKDKVEDRWGKNGSNYKGQYIGYAFEKYGWDNFEHKILLDNITESQAKTLEKEYIQKYNSLYPNGYNIDIGGGMSPNDIYCIETKEIIYKDELQDYIDKNNIIFHNKVNCDDIIACCQYKLKSIKIPWKNIYYHYQYTKYRIMTPEQSENMFKTKVETRKYNNKKYEYGNRFKINGILKCKKMCKYCGDTFTYTYSKDNKIRPNYCNDCARRVKT